MRLAKGFFLPLLLLNESLIPAVRQRLANRRPTARQPCPFGREFAKPLAPFRTHFKTALIATAAAIHNHNVTLPYCHTTTLPHYHSATLPLCPSLTLPRCHIATLSRCHTVTMPDFLHCIHFVPPSAAVAVAVAVAGGCGCRCCCCGCHSGCIPNPNWGHVGL